VETIFAENLLGASRARVCPTEVLCEGACVLRRPIAIGALFLGVGMGPDTQVSYPGDDLPGVWESLPFIERLKTGRLLRIWRRRVRAGAVPPVGGAYDRVLVDERLFDSPFVVFEAGTHDESVRLRTSDLLTIAEAEVADLAEDRKEER
jgi:hypothetical protein